ncbi:tail fiber domain-containing protein, partial [Aeromonas lacus]|uniref:tail fiber domain-containing protein n=1 Tax=Aeromonas lacus TaxID=558884 RepID=UPI00051C1A83
QEPKGDKGPAGLNGLQGDKGDKGDAGAKDALPLIGGTVNGSVTVNGRFRADTVTQSSDLRLKENISPLSSALDKVLKLNGVNYNLIGRDETSCGFIAQEVQEVIPEVVHTDANGMLSIEYASMVSYLVEAIKDLQAQIDMLKGV